MLSVLLLTTFVGVVDGFIVTVAIPSIQAGLRMTSGEAQLVVSVYGLAYAVALVTGGRLGDLLGHRRMFMSGMAGFVAASGACAAATGPFLLIGARVAQGLAAAAMLPQVLSLIRTALPGSRQDRAMGWYGMTVGLDVVAGPVAGSLLLLAADWAGWSWRWIFLVNVPIGVAVLAVALLAVPGTPGRGGARPGSAGMSGRAGDRLDLAGNGLFASGLTALLVALSQGPGSRWRRGRSAAWCSRPPRWWRSLPGSGGSRRRCCR
ncbi:MFS transporter [Nonomuraea ceibae]|uniref:MFS transporter n=1 Tax=Nonomuraea ceibae TaxID=1935170 RepID=UPI001C5F37A9|nr:MFS transporter [Nonomuraea ceibae]